MFGSLKEYEDRSYWEEHPSFFLFLPEEEREYEIIAVLKNYSLYDTALTAGYGEELVTLCTCSYSGKDQRLLVVGRRLY